MYAPACNGRAGAAAPSRGRWRGADGRVQSIANARHLQLVVRLREIGSPAIAVPARLPWRPASVGWERHRPRSNTLRTRPGNSPVAVAASDIGLSG